jgi:hypothetical protein
MADTLTDESASRDGARLGWAMFALDPTRLSGSETFLWWNLLESSQHRKEMS